MHPGRAGTSPHPRRLLSRALGLALLCVVAGAQVSAAAAPPLASPPSTHSSSAAGKDVSLVPVLSGYDRPVAVVSSGAHNRRIFIVEQSGKVKIAKYTQGGWKKVGTFLDLSALVNDPDHAGNEERGLLGLAFAPDYHASGLFYVDYTRRAPGTGSGDSVLAEYRRQTNDNADPHSARILEVFTRPYKNHNGGGLAFGPDGYLYLGLGDGGGNGDQADNARRLDTVLGKILRIDPDDPDGAGPGDYSVPSDNPFYGPTAGVDAIWAYGLRNPWRWSFDRVTGDLWIGDVGQCRYEEIDVSRATAGVDAGKGVDFGWHDVEGRHRFDSRPAHICDPQPLCTTDCGSLPVREISHASGDCAVIGGYVYRGSKYPAWDGYYVSGDLCSGRLRVLDGSGEVVMTRQTRRNISTFGQDRAGRLYAATLDGSISMVAFKGTP